MNCTRVQWSKDFNCSRARARDTFLISNIVIVSFAVPAMYYISVYIASKGLRIVRGKYLHFL